MKLQNKKTGEIGDIAQTSADCIIVYYPIVDGIATTPQKRAIYTSLAQLNEEWQDYEEPKGIQGYTTQDEDVIIRMGSTKEAEKAVEKLKAWTRLRKKGFKFTDYKLYRGSKIIDREFAISAESPVYVDHKDLDLLFGGEDA